ncbi:MULTISPECIES: RNA-binding protein [Pseudoalteromonas]|uniref:RNA-binding protein n=1 Tax=Pseudoalteromonas TaxID=53246 RepID=UPI00057AF45F|nr:MULTISPECIES: RNA-binding protein [Pseudoalteromonas]ATG59584.1 RNA-binding protein [Pseudoalteromonas marina]
MNRFILLITCAVLPFFSFSQNTTVYKCVIKGVPTFSQTPCSKDAEQITLKEINIIEAYKSPTQANNVTDSSVDNFLEVQQIEREISKLQLTLKQTEKTYQEQVKQASYVTQDQANRLGASSIADAIAKKTAPITSAYESKVTRTQQQIDALRQRKQLLSQIP